MRNIFCPLSLLCPCCCAGRTDGAMDAANLFKPMLARGQLRCIGATTNEEYRKYFEKDAAFDRRFQPVRYDLPRTAVKSMLELLPHSDIVTGLQAGSERQLCGYTNEVYGSCALTLVWLAAIQV